MVDLLEMASPSLLPRRPGEIILPCISLWQPYSSLIGVEAKPWETRHWPAPERLIGKWVAIHAAARKPTRDEVAGLDDIVAPVLGADWARCIPYGAVVCIARLTGSYQVRWRAEDHSVVLNDGRNIPDDGFGDYSPGRYCWALEQVRPLAIPSPAKGAQGWFNWTVPDDATTQPRPDTRPASGGEHG